MAGSIVLLLLAPVAAEELAVETVLTGLQAPSCVAIRPGGNADRYEVFVAVADRILWTQSDRADGRGASTPGYSLERVGRVGLAGQAGLLFLNRGQLVVAVSASPDASLGNAAPRSRAPGSDAELLLYELADSPEILSDDRLQQRLRVSLPWATGSGAGVQQGSVARTLANDFVPDALLLACGPPGKQLEFRTVPIRGGMLKEAQTLTPSGPFADLLGPACLEVSDKGFVIVAHHARRAAPAASQLAFLNPIDGSVIMQVASGLENISALACSPRTGSLYAATLDQNRPDRGGVYRIDDAGTPEQAACRAVKLADVARPTSLAFGPDGALYVTSLGESDSRTAAGGKLLRLTGEM